MPFVLDNSVVTGWYLPEQATAYGQSVATRLESDKALVPTLWQLELANVLKTAYTLASLTSIRLGKFWMRWAGCQSK